MKRNIIYLVLVLTLGVTGELAAQEKSPWTTGVDLYSSYVWRGLKFGNGPAMQPTLKYSSGGFTIGGWGNYCFSDNEATEADLFANYAVALGKTSSLTFGATDYYFPSATSPYFTGTSHYFEPSVNLAVGKVALTGAYMFNAKNTYLEADYTAGSITLFAGAGDGQYTKDAKFNLCNVGIKSGSAIKINDHFSIPLTGALILNPSTEQFNIVVGITLANQ
ncbi:MAG: hypothetical protein LWW85_08465 [Marinilabiliales bacterium]|nr:hypothetical protein [Marinilabiliales bacterium]